MHARAYFTQSHKELGVADLVKPYYDPSGALRKRVIVVNEPNYDHTLHDNMPGEESWFGAVIDKKTYDAFHGPLNVDGIAIHHDMNKAVAAQIAQSNPALSAKLLANAAQIDDRMALDAKNAADAKAASLTAWNALDPVVRQAAIDADVLGVPFVAPVVKGP